MASWSLWAQCTTLRLLPLRTPHKRGCSVSGYGAQKSRSTQRSKIADSGSRAQKREGFRQGPCVWGVSWGSAKACDSRGSIHIRILQIIVSRIALLLGLRTKSRILLFIWSSGLLNKPSTPDQSQARARPRHRFAPATNYFPTDSGPAWSGPEALASVGADGSSCKGPQINQYNLEMFVRHLPLHVATYEEYETIMLETIESPTV